MTEQSKQHSLAGTIAILITGLVILVPSGLCTGAMGIAALGGLFEGPALSASNLSFLALVLTIGGPFVIGGAVLVWIAIRRLLGR